MSFKLKSDVWKYFSKINANTAKCKYCTKTIKTSGNTSNLKGHLNIHKRQIEQKSEDIGEPCAKKKSMDVQLMPVPMPSTSKDESIVRNQAGALDKAQTGSITFCQPTISDSFKAMAQFEEGGPKHTRITNAMIYFICKDNMPFSTVEGMGFRKLLKEISPLYKIPSRNTIKKIIIDKYEVISSAYKDKLSKINSLTITSDIWTETMQMKSFLGITVHFLEGCRLLSSCLDVIELSQSHTGAYISVTLNNALKTWKIEKDNVVAIVTDNDAKMLNAIENSFGMNKHLSCFAHTLNLTVQNAIKHSGINELITKVRNIVKFVKASTNASDDLRKEQGKQGIPEGKMKKLILDVATRWNSTFYMCERFLELITIVNNILLSRPNSPPMLHAAEVELLKEVIGLLQIMEKLTVETSGDQYVTISIIIPLINCTIKNFSSAEVKFPLAISLKKALLTEIDKRFGTREQSSLLAMATFLDPRFKNVHFNNPIASSKTLRNVNNLVLEQMTVADSECLSSESDNGASPKSKDIDIWNFHRTLTQKQQGKFKQANLNKDALTSEVHMYISAPLSSLKDNPLEVWEEIKSIYPNLYSVARKYISIVCTSVPSERLFSKAGATISQSRNRLSGKLLPKLLFLNSLPDDDWNKYGL